MSIEDRLKELCASGVSRDMACQLIGTYRQKLDAMIELLGLDWPLRTARLYTIDGITAPLRDHANRLGMKPSTLRNRIERGVLK